MRSLSRFMAILETTATETEGITISGLAERIDLPISTVSRLVRTLTDAHLLELNGSGRYVVGNRVISLARRGMDQNVLAIRARTYMTKLRDLTGETVSLHVPYDNNRVCIAEVRSTHLISRAIPPGEVKPLVGTATGDVLLIDNDNEEIRRLCDAAGLEPAACEGIIEQLRSVRRKGWSFVDTWMEGVSALSVPLRDHDKVIGALTVSGPSSRYDRDAAMRHLEDVLAASRELSRE